jgi:hypothetical protein
MLFISFLSGLIVLLEKIYGSLSLGLNGGGRWRDRTRIHDGFLFTQKVV